MRQITKLREALIALLSVGDYVYAISEYSNINYNSPYWNNLNVHNCSRKIIDIDEHFICVSPNGKIILKSELRISDRTLYVNGERIKGYKLIF